MLEEFIEVHAIIIGDVQGVGFRMAAKKLAIRLAVSGTVRNLADGNVELYLLGKRSAIHGMLTDLTGPQGPGQVSKVVSDEVHPRNSYSDFKIIS